MMFTVLWGVTPCSLVDLHRRFIGRCCHLPVTINRGLLFRAEDENRMYLRNYGKHRPDHATLLTVEE
jgi:hypothetical protein